MRKRVDARAVDFNIVDRLVSPVQAHTPWLDRFSGAQFLAVQVWIYEFAIKLQSKR